MNTNDPIKKAEEIVREVHDSAGKYTQPVLRRYPLLFSFLILFSAAAILHGFELWSDHFSLVKEHPAYLILVGVIALFITGTLYKFLGKNK